MSPTEVWPPPPISPASCGRCASAAARLTVIDPARTRTAELADRHIAPRPGTDAALLFAVVHVLFDEDLVDLGDLAEHVTVLEQVRELAADFPPEAVTEHCGVAADDIRCLGP